MKYCNECKTEKSLNEFHDKSRSKVRKDGSIHKWIGKSSRCKSCHYSLSKAVSHKYDDYYKQYRFEHKEQIAIKTKAWYIATKSKWWLLASKSKTLQCEQCGYNKHSAGLDFHHINPKKKESTIHQLMGGPAPNEDNIKVFETEIQKCIVLCANCHRETHAKYNFLDIGVMTK